MDGERPLLSPRDDPMTEPIHSGRALHGERRRTVRRTTLSGHVLIAAVTILVIGGFLLTGCGSESTTTGHGADNDHRDAPHSADNVAPDLRLTTIDGERIALGDYLGQPVAVIFMHSY